MYKLIFADDEALVRNNIARLVDWNRCGFELIGCCANGHELLELAEKEAPDLVITDINMPYLTGIEAAQRLKKDFPATKIVFLTGYNDFNYAQKAIDLRVVKYILKPVTAQGMVQSLTEIRNTLDEEYLQSTNTSQLEEFYERNRPMLQGVFLNSLLEGGVSDREAKQKIKLLELGYLDAASFQTAVMISDAIEDDNEFSGESEDLINFAIYNISKEILESHHIGTTVFSGKKVVAVAGYADAATEAEAFCTCLEEIRSAIETHLRFTVTIGKGCACSRLSELHTSYEEALAALGYRGSVGDNRVIYIKDIEPKRHSTAVFGKNAESRLISAVKMGNRQEIEKTVGEALQAVVNGREGADQQRYCTLTILLCLLREAENVGINADAVAAQGDMKSVFEMWDTEQMKTLACSCATKLMKSISQNRKNSCSAAIEQAKRLIADGYKNPDLSLDIVSDSLHLSASYFRALFKKESGTTFVNYLTELRMEKAKDLILTTGMKNYEIATEVGYSDPHYFSYCFKKHFKMAPNDLRATLASR